MGSRYLTDLAQVLRAVVPVMEQYGWQTRARSSGGYDSGQPSAIVIHHTASPASADPHSDVAYITDGADAAPISNLYLSRSGTCYVIAAGATNHAGKGGPGWGLPLDGANSRTIGIEAGNTGVGEPWPMIQQEHYLRICEVLCDHYGISHSQVISHALWAPSRKVDPYGPSMFGDGTWNMDRFRASLTSTPPASPPGDSTMRQLVRNGTSTRWNAWVVWDGGKYWIPTNEALAEIKVMFGHDPVEVDDTWMEAMGPVFGKNPTDSPWGVFSE